jgi:hypothetical protein
MEAEVASEQIAQQYVNNFRRRFSGLLKPGIGMKCRILPTATSGTILEFTMGLEGKNADTYEETSPSMAVALGKIEQHAFGGDLSSYAFHGTNTILEPNRIIFIKDDAPGEWSDEAAGRDVAQIVAAGKGAKA